MRRTATVEQELVLVFDTAKAYFEQTGRDFYKLRPTEARKELEKFQEAGERADGKTE
jgi:hypothetical protein